MTPPVTQRKPAPGTGEVFVNWDGTGQWHGVWHADADHVVFHGDREQVIAWARSRPAAARWICGKDGFEPLNPHRVTNPPGSRRAPTVRLRCRGLRVEAIGRVVTTLYPKDSNQDATLIACRVYVVGPRSHRPGTRVPRVLGLG